jgi:hypothetical protein
LSGAYPIQNGLKQAGALSPLLFSFALEYIIKKIQENQEGLGLSGTIQLSAYADVHLLGKNINIIKRNTEKPLDASKQVGLEVNTEKIK